MKSFKALIEEGYEIKAASVVTGAGGVMQQHIFLQKAGDVWVCIFQQVPNGSFTFFGSYQLA